jgi:hypothetical protein
LKNEFKVQNNRDKKRMVSTRSQNSKMTSSTGQNLVFVVRNRNTTKKKNKLSIPKRPPNPPPNDELKKNDDLSESSKSGEEDEEDEDYVDEEDDKEEDNEEEDDETGSWTSLKLNATPPIGCDSVVTNGSGSGGTDAGKLGGTLAFRRVLPNFVLV